MKSDFRLYIGDNLVELGDNPNILYSYTVDDLRNPTAVKNSFSKTITLEGTPNNNKIFGQYWNVERRVGSGGGNAGVDFNASKKAPFTIYVNNEIYESGYVKLDKVNTINNAITYDISLYGGLGDFFYNLTFNPNSGEKKKLSDLDYCTGGVDEFDFTTSSTTVETAWGVLRGTVNPNFSNNRKWQHINFMPAYNGIPDDFDANKVVINLEGTALPQSEANNNTAIAELPDNMTEWEMRDLRSYLQRPCIRMKSVINACCNPDTNGGYNVDLDPDFFNSGNPYYEKTWMTLPMVGELEYSNEEQVLTGSTLMGMATSGSIDEMMYEDLRFDIGEFTSTIPSKISVTSKFLYNSNGDGKPVYPYTSYVWFWNFNGDSYHSGWWCLGSLFVQMIALNGDTVVGASETYNLTSPIRHNGKLWFGHNGHYTDRKYNSYLNKPIYDILGTFVEGEGFCRENENEAAELRFTITGLNSPITALKIVYYWGATEDKVNHLVKACATSSIPYFDGWIANEGSAWRANSPVRFVGDILSSDFKAVLGASLGRTGTQITKALLLNTKESPADYLLSYCKMFGLYFRKDVETNTIHIETRKTFYDRNDIVNLNDLIDRGKDIKINPIVFDTKWYELSQEKDKTAFSDKYLASKGIDYGCKVLNTGYEFSTEKKKLLENSCIRSGIEGLERSKYFYAYNNDDVCRNWMNNGLKYKVVQGGKEKEVEVTPSTSTAIPLNGADNMKYYDMFPKLQLHDKGNKSVDGNNILVFFSGFKDTQKGANPVYYNLTDDSMYQTQLNEGTPCWLFTNSEVIGNQKVADKVRYIPVFERYLTNDASGVVNRSLDFGTAQELYIPTYNITDESNIYTNFWKTYIEDLFDPDTKTLSCYVKVDGKIGHEWMRRFYWFDNSIWRLNRVNDWSVSEYGVTQMEFVKVQDLANYTSVTQSEASRIELTASKYAIDSNGETISVSLTITNNESWRITATSGAVLSTTSGTGDSIINVTFPENTGEDFLYWTITATNADGTASASITIQQTYAGERDFRPVPDDIIIPSSGGTAVIDFIWKNQGDDYIDLVDFNESDDYLQFTADTVTLRTQNKAILEFDPNTGTTTLHNYCQFSDNGGWINHSIGIDQVPPEYVFAASGEAKSMTMVWNKNVTFSNVPDWVTITNLGDGNYTLTAKENLYDVPNDVEIIVDNQMGSRVPVRLRQIAGVSPTVGDVQPRNLFFTNNSATQYVGVNLPNPWGVTTNPRYATLSSNGGDGYYIMGVTMGTTLTGRTDSFTITDFTTNRTYTVNIIQNSAVEHRSLTVNPTAVSVPSGGGIYTITVNYAERGGDFCWIAADVDSGISWTNIVWTGETGTTTVTITPTTAAGQTTKTLNFSGSTTALTATTVFTQDGLGGSARPDSGTQNFPASGGTGNNGITANVNWVATVSDSWISVYPSAGRGNGWTSISITTQPNTSPSARTGYVYIRTEEFPPATLATIIVKQAGFQEQIYVNPSTIRFDYTGGTATFTITSNTNWTIDGNS